MNIQSQKELHNLFLSGHSIRISSGYVDGFVQVIDVGVDERGNDNYHYSSDVYEKKSLAGISVHDVSVYKKIQNWAPD